MNKQMVMMTLASILIIVLLVSSVRKDGAAQQNADGLPSPAPSQETVALHGAGTAGNPASLEVNEPRLPSELTIQLLKEDGAVKLSFPEDSYVNEVAVAQAGDMMVHLLAYAGDSRDRPGVEVTRYDALAVRPDAPEAQLFPLYESAPDAWHEGSMFRAIDDRRIVFVKQTQEEHVRIYDIAELDIAAGSVSVTAPGFWKRYQETDVELDDFLLADWHDGGDKLLLSSFRGKMWLYDRSGGPVIVSLTHTYPAFGDPGSKPPRSLAYPSPDLGRMVYQIVDGTQIMPSNHFQIVDVETHSAMVQFSVEENRVVGDGSLVWNESGTVFMLEHADRDEPLGSSFDNGSTVSAQTIAVFDRGGEPLRSIAVPRGSAERINAFAWASDHELLVEHYMPVKRDSFGWQKGEIDYKLYDVRTGRATALRKVDDASRLSEPVVVLPRAGAVQDTSAFVLMDRKQGLLWDSGLSGRSVEVDGQLYVSTFGGDPSSLFRWDEERRLLEWMADERSGWIRYVGNGWMTAWSREGSGLQYTAIPAERRLTPGESGLPKLPPSMFAEEPYGGEWWVSQGSLVQVLKPDGKAASRVLGKSRYGTVELMPQGEEQHMRSGGELRYRGSYDVVYTNPQGKQSRIAQVGPLALYQESETGYMQVYPMDGYDLLLMTDLQYRFADGGKRIFAYAATKSGEAYPLRFRYEAQAGIQLADAVTMCDDAALALEEGKLVFHAVSGGRRYGLTWEPDLQQRTLTLTVALDLTAEYERLRAVADRYANRLEQALGLTDIDLPEGRMNEERLRELFHAQAWDNPGFRKLREDIAALEEAGTPSRAFAWDPIHMRFDGRGNILLTFRLNLLYAVGHAAHLEALLKLEDGEWRFHDFGTLECEEGADLPDYNGLVIKDQLELA